MEVVPDESGVAKKTSSLAEDQPWLIAAPDTGDLARDKIFVAYQGPRSEDLRVAVADAAVPPNFPLDERAGLANLETPIRALERQPIHEPERFMPFTGTQ